MAELPLTPQPKKRPPLFTSRALYVLIIPLVIERFLDMAVGIVDTLMVASVGEAAVSALSLVDNISNLIIFLIAALSTGGAVVVSQYIGRGEVQQARVAAKQLFYATVIASTILTAIILPCNKALLRLLFGSIDADVMQHTETYLFITAISYPFIGAFNSIAALYRSMGNSKTTMVNSFLMNAINIGGNAILIYGFGMGVAGAAISTLASRIIAAGVMLYLIHDHRNPVYLSELTRFEFKPQMVKSILRIGIPNGLENGMFHLGRLFVQGLVSSFGTASIAANAIVGRILGIAQVPGTAISMAIITVVGQCVGARDYEQATGYTKRLMKLAYIATGACCLIMFLLHEPLLAIFNLSPEATALGGELMQLCAIMFAILWPVAFPFPNVLRAAGDTKFTMVVSMVSMWTARVGMSYVFAHVFNMGLESVWYAMYLDWLIRSIAFLWRYRKGKWKSIVVISD